MAPGSSVRASLEEENTFCSILLRSNFFLSSVSSSVSSRREGLPSGSSQAQNALGYYYSQERSLDPNDPLNVRHPVRNNVLYAVGGALRDKRFQSSNHVFCQFCTILQEWVEAFSWHQAAASNGSADSKCQLGLLYRDGLVSNSPQRI